MDKQVIKRALSKMAIELSDAQMFNIFESLLESKDYLTDEEFQAVLSFLESPDSENLDFISQIRF